MSRSLILLPALLWAVVGLPLPRTADAQLSCLNDLQCADGDLCNGVERCVAGECLAAPPLACDDGDPCTQDTCDPTLGCTHVEQADPPNCITSSECLFAADHVPCVADGDRARRTDASSARARSA